jgi:hypothetical protein
MCHGSCPAVDKSGLVDEELVIELFKVYEINKRSECHRKSLTDHGNVFKLGVSMLDAVADNSQASRSRFVLISDECGTSFRIKNDLTLYLPGRKF